MLPLISVMPHLRRWSGRWRRTYRHWDTQFLEAQCVAADPAEVGTTGAQSTACVYGYAQSACRRGETDQRLLIDYYKTNIDYEKTQFNIPN